MNVMPHDFRKLAENVDAASAMAMLASAADILLVMSGDGHILNASTGGDGPSSDLVRSWTGKSWKEVSTVESAAKIDMMLSDAAKQLQIKWRQINHPTGDADLAVKYFTMKAGTKGDIVAVGRDLRMVAELQQRLVAAEQAVEAEFARLRSSETRYRVLFQSISEAVLVVDTRTGAIIEANDAAAQVLDTHARKLLGMRMTDCLGAHNHAEADDQLKRVIAKGVVEDIAIRIGEKNQVVLSMSLFRQDNKAYVMVRLLPLAAGAQGVVVPKARSRALTIIDEMPDAFVVTDSNRQVLLANKAFLDLAQVGTEEQVRGEALDRWLGRNPVDLSMLFNRLSEHGAVRNFVTVTRGNYGTMDDVEVSAVSVPGEQVANMGFVIRRTARRPASNGKQTQLLQKSAEQMAALVGKVPLKDLVRETTDIVERLCIEAALQMNENNRASTAEMLGLSRQSLYNRLERFGIGDTFDEN
jgi:transcriptional regulator PpsR